MGQCAGKERSNDNGYEYTGVNKEEPRDREDTLKGPVQDRSCTDVICCILFTICILALGVLAVWAFTFGDIRRIIYPTDSMGRICGVEVKDRPNLLFFDYLVCVKMGPAVLVTGCPTPQVCVKKCPDYTWSWHWSKAKDVGRHLMVCKGGLAGDDPTYSSRTVEDLVKSSECAPYIFPTLPMAGRCMPKNIHGFFTNKTVKIEDKEGVAVNGSYVLEGNMQMEKFSQFAQVVQKMFNDIYMAKFILGGGILLAIILSLLWIILLRFFAKVMVWLTLLLFVIIFATSTVLGFVKWHFLKVEQDARKVENSFVDSMKTGSATLFGVFERPNTWLVIGIVSAVILVIVLLILIFLRQRIRIAIAIINETSKAISYMMSVLLWPIFPVIIQIIVIAFALALCLTLASVRSAEGIRMNYNETDNLSLNASLDQRVGNAQLKLQTLAEKFPCDPLLNGTGGSICHFVKYGGKNYVIFLQLYNAFMFFWLFNFVIALGQMTLAGAFASYYFAAVKPKDLPGFPLGTSFCRAFRYHMGTMAFGSLIVALLQLVRVILEYIDAKTKQGQNACTEFLMKCLKCCFWCLEKFIKFLNKRAFIMVAIYGQSFCSAAKNAFNLILRNLVRVVVVDKVADFILFVGKLVICGGVGTLSYFFCDGTLARKSDFFKWFTPQLTYFYIPVIILIISTYIVATLFFGVYEMGVETLFLCFLEDTERNDGSTDKPFFMSTSLKEILGKENVKPSTGSKENLEAK